VTLRIEAMLVDWRHHETEVPGVTVRWAGSLEWRGGALIDPSAR
jgi:hypothetical protein